MRSFFLKESRDYPGKRAAAWPQFEYLQIKVSFPVFFLKTLKIIDPFLYIKRLKIPKIASKLDNIE